MKKFLLLFILIVSVSGFSQKVNNYQYVIVPTKFSIFKENDKYRLNSTTRMLLEKYGFKTFLSTDDIPKEIGDCKRLYADLVQDKDFLKTKVKIVLKDCKETVIYETDYGVSREKDFAAAYTQALRETTKSFDKLNYKYNGNFDVELVSIPAKENTSSAEFISGEPEPPLPPDPPIKDNPFSGAYFAQPTITGFQVIDNEPKVIMRLFNTSQKDVFIAEKGSIKGIVISKNGQWLFEYYQNARLVSEPIKLKF